MSHFRRALGFTLKHEGGWADNPADPGGATMEGVTLATYSDFLGRPASKAELRMMPGEHRDTIYFNAYWLKASCGLMPGPIAAMVFDMAVNHGTRRAQRFLQRALVHHGQALRVDGIAGARTLRALRAVPVSELIGTLTIKRLEFYTRLRTFRSFGTGWTRRATDLWRFARRWQAETPPSAKHVFSERKTHA